MQQKEKPLTQQCWKLLCLLHKLTLTKSCYSSLKAQLLIAWHLVVTVTARRSRARGRHHCVKEKHNERRARGIWGS